MNEKLKAIDSPFIPKTEKEKKEWMEYYMKYDPIVSIWLENGINEESLTYALLAKCAEFDKMREKEFKEKL